VGARRQLLLFLAAVLLPCAVVVAAGARLVVQERELAVRRRDDARRSAAAAIRQRLLARLEEARLRELSAIAVTTDSTPPHYADTSAALVARIDAGTVVLPWHDDSAALAFAGALDDPALSRLASRRLFARLVHANRLPAAERKPELEAIAAADPAMRDEFGVPLALYAAQALRDGRWSPKVVTRALVRARDALLSSRVLSPSACYAMKDLARPDTARIASRCADLDAAEALAREAPQLVNAASSAAATPIWMYWPQRHWLVSTSAVGARRYLVALRSPIAIVGPGEGAEALGGDFPGAYVRVPPSRPESRTTVVAFIVAALVVMIALAVTSARLLWRDVRREVQAAALRSDFVSGVTHELKTPLAAIRMYAETMREYEGLPARRRGDYLDIIVGESERLTRLIDNVLDFSRIDRGDGARPTLRPLSINNVVANVARTMAHPIEQQGFQLALAIPAETITVLGDRDSLEQAVLNLVTNAMKYSGEARDIALTLSVRGRSAVLDVVDHGIGIAEHDRERIFDRFYRAATRDGSAVTGAGLGLTIVRDVINAHGGRIAVTSTPGAGSRFTVTLPLHDDAADVMSAAAIAGSAGE
jgi:signal transduction histidine kinase